MNQSSAEFPIDRIIAACETVFDFERETAAREWDSKPAKHAEWLLEYESRDVFIQARGDGGLTRLYWLAVAAKASGESKMRVTAADFYPIFSPYLGQKNK